MNLHHLYAIVCMKWQTVRNQFRKTGTANKLLTVFLLVFAAITSIGSFVFAAGSGNFLLSQMDPFHVIYVWDLLALLFLFAWTIGLMMELQRTEMLSLKNLLHLPVSVSGAFMLNYISSFASLTMLFFLPGMLGFCVASVVHFGAGSLVVFALLAAFLFMVTGVSYQLRGWLARMMENKRTRGTVIAMTTTFFVLIFQIPYLVNISGLGGWNEGSRLVRIQHRARLDEYRAALKSGEWAPDEYQEAVRREDVDYPKRLEKLVAFETERRDRIAQTVNAILPIGWMPYGASAAARGDLYLPWIFVLGMSTIGAGSLALAFRSTQRAYTGEQSRRCRNVRSESRKDASKASIMERKLPLLTEAQSVITFATMKSTLRAPEAKMALLTPFIFVVVFGSMIVTGPMSELPEIARSVMGIAALMMSLVGMVQLMLNSFGLDRHGFRAFVLMPVERRDILLGKNLGIFPIAGTLSGAMTVITGIALQLPITHVVATVLQTIVAFFLFFLVGNHTSIMAPIGMAIGTMKPVSKNFSVMVTHFFAVFFIFAASIPALLALGVDIALRELAGVQGVPVYLLLTVVQVPLVILFYLRILDHQGQFLQDREQQILEVVTKVAD